MEFSEDEERHILERAGITDVVSPAMLSEIKEHYDDPFRHYHNWQHALSVVAWVNHVVNVFQESQLAPYKPIEMALAGLLHDVIYTDQWTPKNEEDSAAFLVEHFPEHKAGADLILATADHGKREKDYPFAVRAFLDCDLAFFLADPRWEVFKHYNHLIELEYMKIYEPEQVFEGRRKFLRGMLAHRRIFLTEYFYERFELCARANLERLLLDSPTPTVSLASH